MDGLASFCGPALPVEVTGLAVAVSTPIGKAAPRRPAIIIKSVVSTLALQLARRLGLICHTTLGRVRCGTRGLDLQLRLAGRRLLSHTSPVSLPRPA